MEMSDEKELPELYTNGAHGKKELPTGNEMVLPDEKGPCS